MRFKDCQEQQTYLEHTSSLGNVELVYAGLDVLGSTPWKVNRKIFDVMLKVCHSGECRTLPRRLSCLYFPSPLLALPSPASRHLTGHGAPCPVVVNRIFSTVL